ncbi:hypothetical protein GJ700_00615 [Duganella sp. FT92W]|uniref:DUF7674 domain-containing protein n=1 Tax=Pseudoduganella rivuli TaxID=2666085 RepID=A0A7X2IIL5_9BURK|nr:hypothetical protein [Pseudoduganella rivuli]MRV70222.1 hypothetical protein [Pseudoduganella rivuli]
MSEVYPDEKGVVARVRERFPEEANRTDGWLRERGWDDLLDDSPHIWMEAFADRTTEAVRARDWNLVKEHTGFIAAECRNGTEVIRRLVDVSYAENLMWDLEESEKAVAWPNIAKELRDMYERAWGRWEWMNQCDTL